MAAKASAALPNKLWVGTYEFALRVVPKDHPRLVTGEEAHGITIFDADDGGPTILIASNLPTRQRLEVVWHEITHVINWVAGLWPIGDDGKEQPNDDEEEVADKHGVLWTQLLLDNPNFSRWLSYTLDRIRKERKAPSNAESMQPEASPSSASPEQHRDSKFRTSDTGT